MSSDWRDALTEHRHSKDEYLTSHPQSPLPPAKREEFEGLAYDPPEPSLRFELPLDEHDETQIGLWSVEYGLS